MKMKLIKQYNEKDCGAACFAMICDYYGLEISLNKARNIIQSDINGVNIMGIIIGAEKVGLLANALEGNPDELLLSLRNKEISYPFIARIITKTGFEHYVIVCSCSKRGVKIYDPDTGKQNMCIDDFLSVWGGQIILFDKTDRFQKKKDKTSSWKKFFGLVSSQKKLFIKALVLSIIISIVALSGTFIFELLIDEEVAEFALLPREIYEKTYIIFIFIGIAYVISFLCQIFRGYILAKVSKNIDMKLILGYYKHVIKLPIAFFADISTGDLMARLGDASNVREAVANVVLTVLLDGFLTIIGCVIMARQNWSLFFVALSIILAYLIVVICFKKPIKKANQDIMINEAIISSYLKESINGIETIKACNAENKIEAKATNKFKLFVDKNVKYTQIRTWQDGISQCIGLIGILIILSFGYYLSTHGQITMGELMTFYAMFGYFLTPIKNLLEIQPKMQTALVAIDRLNDIFETEIEESYDNTQDGKNLKGDIILNNVSFKYGSRKLVLEDITFSVKQGEKIAIVGESGCGKTTLVKLIMAFYKPLQGQILINKKNINFCGPHYIRDRIAYVEQETFLFSDSFKNNLLLGCTDVSEKRMEDVCKLCMIHDYIKSTYKEYDTVIEEGGKNLSGGQKQRLAIARALLREPDILILDEATSNLDVITENEIKSIIDKLDITCIIIAHRLSTIKNCDKILVMQSGKIVEEGTHNQLMGMRGIYSNYIDSAK